MAKKINDKTWAKWGAVGLGASSALGLATLGLARYVVDQLTNQPPVAAAEAYTFTPFETQVDYEEISFATTNDRMLSGWWLPRPESSRVVIAVSGYRGKKEDMLGISSIMWRAGINVLMFDYRGYGAGRLNDELVTLGPQELEDMQAAIRYVKGRVEKPQLGLLGGSMGASVALLATARDQEVLAVWADSGFSSQPEVIKFNWHKTTHLPGGPVLNLANRLFHARTGYRWQDFAPIKEIGQIAPRPVYLIHGSADTIVPVEHAYQLYAAAGQPKTLWIEEGIDHCGIYFYYRDEYARRALEFFGQYLVETDFSASTTDETAVTVPVGEK